MSSFFKSLFGSKEGQPATETEKDKQRKFDIFKYDGIKALKIGKTGYAERCFKEALALEEEFETLNYLAITYVQQHETKEAIRAYSRMTELDPTHIETFLNRAQLNLQQEQPEAVIADCLQILSLKSDEYRAYFLMAKAKEALNRQVEAVADLDRTISLQAEAMDAYLLRANLQTELKQFEKALADVNTALSLSPEEENAFIQRAVIYESTGKIQEALNDYSTVIELNPFHEQAYLEAGRILMDIQQVDKAIRYFDEAIENKPDFAQAYTARGKAKEHQGDLKGAQEDFKMGLELGAEEEETESRPVNFNEMYANRPL